MRTQAVTLGLLFLNLFADSVSASCGHGTSLLKRKVSIDKRQEGGAKKTVEVGKFGYIGTQGPTGWAALSAENAGCSTSTQQSPIDITNTSTTLVPPGTLKMNFPATESAEFENIGTTIEVVMEGKNASTTVNGKDFALKQFHFHSPSEHTIDGEYFPLEMHMVHQAADGAIAVIAAQFQLTEDSSTTSLLTSVVTNIGAITTPGTITTTSALDFAPLVSALNAQSLSTYAGSLTTPPCAEGLTFFVTTQQLPLDVKTFNQIKSVVGFNARFAQNGAGQENLLSLAAKQVGGAAPAAPAAPSSSSASTSSATSTSSAAATASAAPAEKIEAAPAAPATPAVPSQGNGNVQVIGGNNAITPETAKLLKDLLGVDVAPTA